MTIAFTIVTILIGIEHLGIMLLEMIGSPATQAKAFELPESFTQQREARISFANQGIYNGVLGAALILSQWLFSGIAPIMVGRLLLLMVAIVGLYGGMTATKKILLIQFIPAIIGLILSI